MMSKRPLSAFVKTRMGRAFAALDIKIALKKKGLPWKEPAVANL
jgi:hypothetical protein